MLNWNEQSWWIVSIAQNKLSSMQGEHNEIKPDHPQAGILLSEEKTDP